MDKLHCIHSRNGRIGPGTDTTPADLDAIVDALRADGRGHLLLYFHGGLVNKASGLAGAARLTAPFSASAYPVFYVWESGVFEAIANNLRELPDEPVFKNLVRKALEYALGRLGGSNGTRSIAPGAVDPERVRAAIDTYWADRTAATVPYRGFDPLVGAAQARSAALVFDENEIVADLESDAELERALQTLPDQARDGRNALGGGPAAAVRDSDFARAVAAQVSEVQGARGLISWIKVALLLKRIVQAILRRYSEHRDHGLYATVVEEVMRGVRMGGSSLNEWGKALEWNRMKQDTLDAFGDDPLHAGTALIQRLAAAQAAGMPLTRITLVGHSTGAIYIAHWLAKAASRLPASVAFEVVYLAPAITYQLFARTVAEHGERIARFRMFCMRDEFERADQVWGPDEALQDGRDWRRFVYPSSLLYLVSGILESRIGEDGEAVDEADMPLLGMQRFFAWDQVYSDAKFPEVAAVRAWLGQRQNAAVWSKSAGQGDGLNSSSIDHGAFDDDEDTLASVAAVLRGW